MHRHGRRQQADPRSLGQLGTHVILGVRMQPRFAQAQPCDKQTLLYPHLLERALN